MQYCNIHYVRELGCSSMYMRARVCVCDTKTTVCSDLSTSRPCQILVHTKTHWYMFIGTPCVRHHTLMHTRKT